MLSVNERLKAGGLVVLDGGTGTELERRGAPMHDAAWCASATLSHPELLRDIHADYIEAGADVITANTFSGNRNMLGPAGLGDKIAEINIRAVELAREARERAGAPRPIAVAGSMSHQVPVIAGTDERDPTALPSLADARRNFEEIALHLAEGGVDLILMEMMSDPALAVPAIEAALGTGLPVWVGLSCRRNDKGELVAYSRAELSFEEAAREIMSVGGEVAGVMHSHVNLIEPALKALRAFWYGPLMAYPDSGYFKMPNWQFEDVIPAAELAALGKHWVHEHGLQVMGGCCGLGVEHIAALHDAIKA